ncbi:unnamed protein product [Polarella glacialis]|uniref:Uncharacterized protein n=1 Tax=Polarella glacialis TaxID=89957 RepID=A0A813DUC9_POLGL|nr:unnamed protein product [Polarella glacialis]
MLGSSQMFGDSATHNPTINNTKQRIGENDSCPWLRYRQRKQLTDEGNRSTIVDLFPPVNMEPAVIRGTKCLVQAKCSETLQHTTQQSTTPNKGSARVIVATGCGIDRENN